MSVRPRATSLMATALPIQLVAFGRRVHLDHLADAGCSSSSAAVPKQVAVEVKQSSPLRCKRKCVNVKNLEIEYVGIENLHGKMVYLSKKLAFVAYAVQEPDESKRYMNRMHLVLVHRWHGHPSGDRVG